MESATALTRLSTEFTTVNGTRYTWTGLTVDRQSCTPSRIGFMDTSFINLSTGYVFVAQDSAGTITVTRPNRELAAITAQDTYEHSTLVRRVENHGSGTVIVQGSGLQVNIF